MRTLLAGEFDTAVATSPRATAFVKLEVENGSGTFKDLNALLGYQWIIEARIIVNVNTKVSSATFRVIQKIGTASLAPLIAASTVNVLDDGVTYSPLLDKGRLVRASTATMAHGVAIDTGKLREVFTGRINTVSLNDQGGLWAGPITLECSDLGAWLQDLQVENPTIQYGDEDSPPNMEDVLQSVIDDNLPVGDPAVTVVKTSTSNFAVTGYIQGDGNVMDALTGLVLDSVGEDIRYRYNASHVCTLQWFDPQRSRVTIDGTFAKTVYILRKLDQDIRDVRNAGAMAFTDVDAGRTGVARAESLTSIDKYRRRWFRLPASDMLSTEAEAQRVINAVVNDLAESPAEAQATLPYLWFVQLYDRYTFSANGRQYDTDQTFSVVGYEHVIESGRAMTTLTLTANIVGAYAEWHKRIRAGGSVFQTASILRVSSTESTDGTTRDFTITIGARVDTVHLHYRTVPVDVLGDPLDFSGNETVTEPVTTQIFRRVAGSDQITFSIPHPAEGFKVAGRLVPYTIGVPDPIEGTSWPFFLFPSALDAPAQGTVSISSNGAWEVTADGPVNAASFRWSSSTSAYPADATAQASGTLVTGTGRLLAISGGAALTFGQTIYITIVPFDAVAGGGNALPVIHLRGSYQTFTATKTTSYSPAIWTLDPNGSDQPDFSWTGFVESDDLTAVGMGPVRSTSLVAHPVLPDGVTVTEFALDVYNGDASSPTLATSEFSVARLEGATGTSLGTDFSTAGIGWQTLTSIVSEDTTGRTYSLNTIWSGGTTSFGGELKNGQLYVTYISPDPRRNV